MSKEKSERGAGLEPLPLAVRASALTIKYACFRLLWLYIEYFIQATKQCVPRDSYFEASVYEVYIVA